MKLFVFKRLSMVSGNYHPEGGCVIVAKDKKEAIKMTEKHDYLDIDSEDWDSVVDYELTGNYPSKIYIFPDAGCC